MFDISILWNYYFNLSLIISVISVIGWTCWFIYYVIKKPIDGPETGSFISAVFMGVSLPVLNILVIIYLLLYFIKYGLIPLIRNR